MRTRRARVYPRRPGSCVLPSGRSLRPFTGRMWIAGDAPRKLRWSVPPLPAVFPSWTVVHHADHPNNTVGGLSPSTLARIEDENRAAREAGEVEPYAFLRTP